MLNRYEHPYRKSRQAHPWRRCHRCRGTGFAPCQICNGSGAVAKGRDLFGNVQFGGCSGCHGMKNRKCTNCGGTGLL